MARITVDGVALEVPDGSMLLPSLLDRGWQIPHYCYHPKLSIDGCCRMCLVKVEGMPKLTISCNTPVRDGMVVDTKGPEVAKARQGVLELLLVNHPLDCPICDQAGECYLQDYAFEYGSRRGRTQEPRRKLSKRVEIGSRVVLDQERCILCRRCVRFCSEITQTRELAVFNMGDRSVVDTFPGLPLENDYSICTADICPVGALLSKDFHHKMRVWFLDEAESVCPGCANGCNIKVGSARQKVYRLLPRRNDDVNGTWMCDEGRLGYRSVNDNRLRTPMVSQDGVQSAVSWDAALENATRRLTALAHNPGGGALAAIVSGHLTNEELFVLMRLINAGFRTRWRALATRAGRADEFLIKAEKAPNGQGARNLGLSADGEVGLSAIRAGIERGDIRGLFVTGTDVWDLWGDAGPGLFRKLDSLVVQAANEHPLVDLAHVVLPGLTFAEKEGTFTNAAGRVQRIHRALDPGDHPTDGEVFLALSRRLGVEVPQGGFEPRRVFEEVVAEVPAYRGMTWNGLGATGVMGTSA